LKNLSRKKLIIIGLVFCLTVFLCFVIFHKTYSPIVVIPDVSKTIPSVVFTRFRIPKIEVDTTIEYVGITEAGAMDVPKGPDEVGWYSLGTRPGDVGSAVMAGHRGWREGKTAVFDDLDKLRIGDKVEIEDDTGKIISFIVTKTRTYDKDAIVPEVFNSSEGKHLNLISCVGDWDKKTGSSTKRLVVFTDMINQ